MKKVIGYDYFKSFEKFVVEKGWLNEGFRESMVYV